jgi:hypothetical protein
MVIFLHLTSADIDICNRDLTQSLHRSLIAGGYNESRGMVQEQQIFAAKEPTFLNDLERAGRV